MKKKALTERFDLLLTSKEGIKVFDTRHAKQEFKKHFPKTNWNEYIATLQQGISALIAEHGKSEGNYMINSKSIGIRIPLELRQDRFSSDMIGAVPTTLAPHEIHNVRKDINVLVERSVKNNEYMRFPLCEGFDYYLQSGRIFSDFEEIDI